MIVYKRISNHRKVILQSHTVKPANEESDYECSYAIPTCQDPQGFAVRTRETNHAFQDM